MVIGYRNRQKSDPQNYRLKKYVNIKIINDDILKINLPKLIEENNFQNYKVVANLPYYITSKIIRLLLETKYPPREMILMVQKEVGKRIVRARWKRKHPFNFSQILCRAGNFFEVPRENFDPAPEVDSAVIRIKRKKNIPNVDIKSFFSLVRAGFSAKRKLLMNNLSSTACTSRRKRFWNTLKKAGLGPSIRAEKLGVEDWVKLYEAYQSKRLKFEGIS